MQIRDQVGYGIGAQGHAFNIHAVPGIDHRVQPHCLGTVHRTSDGIQQIDRTGLLGPELIDDVHAALVVLCLLLPLQIPSLHARKLVILLLGSRHFGCDALLLPIELVPVS